MKKIAIFALSLFLFSTLSLPALAVDQELPGDVEGLQVTPLNGSVKLVWIAATDNVGVDGYQVHYGLTPVKEKGQKFDTKEDVGNVIEYTAKGLENDKKYYFAVVAYDAAGNESKNWSAQLDATPSEDLGGATDKDAPQVAEAEAMNKEEVKVVFSEEVVLPEEDAEDEFNLENSDDLTLLPVNEAKLDEEDKTNKTVILSTEAQKENVEYKLTAGIGIKDKSGNPIISGTSDTAVFQGSGKEKPADDTAGPVVVKAEAVDNTHFLVTFNEAVVLEIDPSENFKISSEDDETVKLQVLGVEMGVNLEGIDNAIALVKSSPQEDKNYVIKVVKVKDEAGNQIDESKSSVTFKGTATGGAPDNEGGGEGGKTPPADIIAPKDVANFLADKMFEAGKYMVTLKWSLPSDAGWDSVIQQIYTSTDKGENYSKTADVATDKTEYQVGNLDPGEYWFKITQKDAAGNESAGIVTTVILSETGPEMLGLVFLSLGLGRVITRRKKK